MTINGQLLCLQLLHELDDYIYKIIEVNTDGVVIYINKMDYEKVLEICNYFENKYSLVIDTRTILNYGFFYLLNKKIINIQNSTIIKGFQSSISFTIKQEILKKLLNNHTDIFINYKNITDKEIYNKIWICFNEILNKLLY